MKRINIILVAIFSTMSLFGQEDAITKLFSNYLEQEAFNSVFVSQKMFEMISNAEIEDMDADTKGVIASIAGLRILSTDENGVQLFKDSRKTLSNQSYEVLMTLKDDDQDVEFFIRDSKTKGKVAELVLMVGGEKGFTLMSFVGDLELNKLSKLASKMEINGLEHLGKLTDN